MDAEMLLEIIQTDFQYFLSDQYLVLYQVGGGPLLHTRYHLEFLHDGNWFGMRYKENMQSFKPKYQRRIERFRELASFKGTVYFIRSSYQGSLSDPHRFYKIKENLEVTEEYSIRLYETLKKRFLNLKFYLIIVNTHDRDDIEIEKKVKENLLMIRANSSFDLPKKAEKLKKFYLSL